MIASPEPSLSEESSLTEPKQLKTPFTPLVAGSELTKSIARKGWLASKAKREADKLAKLNPSLSVEETHKHRRLARVRKQLDTLQDCFDEALAGTLYTLDKKLGPVQVFDPAHIDRIAAAIARVAELERQLSDWALPGSKRPKPESTRRSPSICLPTDENE